MNSSQVQGGVAIYLKVVERKNQDRTTYLQVYIFIKVELYISKAIVLVS